MDLAQQRLRQAHDPGAGLRDPGDPAEGSHVAADGMVEHPLSSDYGAARILPADRTWFQRAVFYEVLVRAFADSNGDGSGDIRGLIDKLDYLKWLGVDCLWLPPFYDSPLRGGGVDTPRVFQEAPGLRTAEGLSRRARPRANS